MVNSFDGTMPAERLGELPAGDQLRLFQLNGLPNRPCTARFSLPDNSVDARTILEQIMDTGVQRNHILCIQRLRTGMVEVTFAKKEDCDLFLSRAAIPSRQRPFTFSRSSRSSTIFVTVRDAPWELSDKLIADRLEQYGTVISIRRTYNQSLLPEKVHDGRRVLRMVLRRDIPSFIKFGPFLVRVFYPGQPKHCPLSVILHFPPEVYLSRGVGDLCPLLVRALHANKISALQFLRGGRVRVTVREPAFREELLSNDLIFEDRKIPVTPAGVHVIPCSTRDSPSIVGSAPRPITSVANAHLNFVLIARSVVILHQIAMSASSARCASPRSILQ